MEDNWRGSKITESAFLLIPKSRKTRMEMVTSFLYPPPPSILLTTMTVVGLAALPFMVWSEVRGNNLKYSKFNNNNASSSSSSQKQRFGSISSRTGMLFLYTPAFLAASASFFISPSVDLRFLLLKSALSLHFFKRVFEVLFIHKYSGGMPLDVAFTISSGYFSSTTLVLYSQSFTVGLPQPDFDLKFSGVVMFVVGIVGNLYHHVLLAKLRTEGEGGGKKEYKIPKGGLFGAIICPHYMFEILVFWGFFMISQTIYSLSWSMGTTFYLIGRSYATRRWYLSKFDDFPKRTKALIPFVF
ncbi:3-oxo-5-alpha-steroid 4-dehydrogenase family protein [Hirschfeldia incana]|nr:3-oxo-5-alpha-steroid 4-dehydrogenase family protein [Hirschfeldia incana]